MALFFYAITCISCHHRIAPRGSATFNMEVKDQRGNPQLSGRASRQRLEQTPYGDWFVKNYDSYRVDSLTAGNLRAGLTGKRLVVFMGTWCGDSRREVPRFFKILDYCGIDSSSVDLVMVNYSDSMYKQSPGHEEKGLDIFRVPDFIVMDRGREIGRIVESPVASLEKDLLSIVSGEAYTPQYRGGAFMAQMFHREKMGKLRRQFPQLTEKLRPLVSSPGELSSYAKVLQAAGEPEKAALVKDLNGRLFPGK